MPILEAHFVDQPELLELLKQKGSFPFEWYNDIRKWLETSLPSIEKWYFSEKLKKLSEAEYRRAQAVWAQLGESSTIRNYHDVYFVADTLHLADWVEAYRNLFLELFRLDPMYYYGASNVSC